jgi:hypothetical protein
MRPDLYRLGNRTGPRMNNVREKENRGQTTFKIKGAEYLILISLIINLAQVQTQQKV